MDAANSWASGSSNPSLKNNSWDAKPPSIWGDSKVQSEASKWGVENCDNWNRGKESGWGAVSPVPNAGTEAWGCTQGESKQQQTQINGPKEIPGTKTAWGMPPAPTGAWSRGNPMNATSQPPAQTPPVAPSSWAEAVSSKGSSNPPSLSGAQSDDGSKSQEEMISSAINSMDNWGKTMIRQDTAWVIEEPQGDGTVKLDAQPEEQVSLSNKHLINGTAIWENQKNKPSDKPTFVNGPTAQPAFQMPKPTWPPTPTTPSNATPWNTQPQVSQENAWEKKEDERSAWDQSVKTDINWDKLQANNNWEEKTPTPSEASTWTDEKLAVSSSSVDIDDGTSVWGDPINQGWRTGKSQHHDIEPTKLISPINNQTTNAWNSIPSQLKSDVSWSNDMLSNKVKSSSTGSWSDINDLISNNRPIGDNGLIKNQLTQRSVLLQKLLSFGFKVEDAQAILISNNTNLENTMSELLSMKRDEMLSKSAGASSINPSSAAAAANLLSSSLHNSLHIDSIPPRTNAPPMLPPPQLNMPPPPLTNLGNQVLGNLGNQGLSNLGSQSMGLNNTSIGNPVLTQQQMLQLSQEIQLVVQSGLLPANALNQTTLTNPAFIHALQQLIGHHTVHQKLLIQSVQPGLTQLQQQKLIEMMGNEQKVITATKAQLLQLALNSHIQIPNNIHPPTLHTPTMPGSSIQGSGLHAGLGDGVASSSRLISQWKVSSDLETKKMDSNVWLPTTTNNNATWPDISNTTTSTSLEGTGSGVTVGEDGVALEIEEFIPGKPWVGPNQKNVEDDPFITPGSVPRNSLSTVNDIQVMNILGKKNKIQISSTTPILNSTQSQNRMGGWPSTNRQSSEGWPTNGATFSAGLQSSSGLGNGLGISWNHLNRSTSWTPGDHINTSTSQNLSGAWLNSSQSYWLLIKTHIQIESNMLHQLLSQSGSQVLNVISGIGESLASFGRPDDAMRCRQQLNALQISGTNPIHAEFITEQDVLLKIQTMPPPPTATTPWTQLQHQQIWKQPNQLSANWNPQDPHDHFNVHNDLLGGQQ